MRRLRGIKQRGKGGSYIQSTNKSICTNATSRLAIAVKFSLVSRYSFVYSLVIQGRGGWQFFDMTEQSELVPPLEVLYLFDYERSSGVATMNLHPFKNHNLFPRPLHALRIIDNRTRFSHSNLVCILSARMKRLFLVKVRNRS